MVSSNQKKACNWEYFPECLALFSNYTSDWWKKNKIKCPTKDKWCCCDSINCWDTHYKGRKGILLVWFWEKCEELMYMDVM